MAPIPADEGTPITPQGQPGWGSTGERGRVLHPRMAPIPADEGTPITPQTHGGRGVVANKVPVHFRSIHPFDVAAGIGAFIGGDRRFQRIFARFTLQ